LRGHKFIYLLTYLLTCKLSYYYYYYYYYYPEDPEDGSPGTGFGDGSELADETCISFRYLQQLCSILQTAGKIDPPAKFRVCPALTSLHSVIRCN